VEAHPELSAASRDRLEHLAGAEAKVAASDVDGLGLRVVRRGDRAAVSAVERPEPHVGTPLETVDERLHVSRAEALEEHALLVGLAIAVAIRRVEDHGSLRDDDAALVARDAGRPVQVIDEDARSIEAAVE